MPDSTIVPYRVYWVIFLRPASPSFASRSRLGMTTVRSARRIDAEMYGMMPSPKIESRLRLPPENRSTMPRSVPWTWSKNCASAWPSIPGVGTCAPTRYATSSTAVMMTRRLSSGILKTFWKLWRLSITKPAPARGASRLDRALWPLWPFVDVLPWPDPGPRPIFFRRFVAPGAGRSSSSFTGHTQHVGDLGDHAAHRRRVVVADRLANPAESQRPHRRLLLGR